MPARNKPTPPTETPAAPPPERWMTRAVPGGTVRLLRDTAGPRLLVAFDPPGTPPAAVRELLQAGEFAPDPGTPGVWAKAVATDRLFVDSVIAEGVLLAVADALSAPPTKPKGRGR